MADYLAMQEAIPVDDIGEENGGPDFGDDGTSHSGHGFALMFIFRSAVIGAARKSRCATLLLYGRSRGFGMVQAGTLLYGAFISV